LAMREKKGSAFEELGQVHGALAGRQLLGRLRFSPLRPQSGENRRRAWPLNGRETERALAQGPELAQSIGR